MEKLKDIPKYHTKWNMREEEFQKIVLTKDIEFHIIELPKFKEYQKKNWDDKINIWLNFIERPGEIAMENGKDKEFKEIKDARKVLEDISQDEHERWMANLREKYILDQNAIRDAGYEDGVAAGKKAGIEEGKKTGIEEGEKNKSLAIAKKMKAVKADIDFISQMTGLTKEEIEKL